MANPPKVETGENGGPAEHRDGMKYVCALPSGVVHAWNDDDDDEATERE